VAIVSISKIQHRRGIYDDLPQLSSAEFGWALDQRRLFIGNGTLEEGAPEIGNTEILTTNSDIGASINYVYTGLDQTGYVTNGTVNRNLLSKLDDFVNVRDFGATGDGINDDTIAINLAMVSLYCAHVNNSTYRILYFPAGTYNVTDTIKIPSHANLIGEGIEATIIKLTSATPTYVARTADSKFQVDTAIGTTGGTAPTNVSVQNITFYNSAANNVFALDYITNSQFLNCEFKAVLTAPVSSGTDACIVARGSSSYPTRNVSFSNCQFKASKVGVKADNDNYMSNINFTNCEFNTLYQGLKLGTVSVGPTSVKVIGSYFDNINDIGCYVLAGSSKNSSAYNYYNSVGGTSPATNAVIKFVSSGNISFGDVFTRSTADELIYPTIDVGGTTNMGLVVDRYLAHGKYRQGPGLSVTLTNNISSATSTTVTFAATDLTTEVYYSITRGTKTRHGVFRIVSDTNGTSYSDDYEENNGDVGVTLSATFSGGTVTMKYTTTNTGASATLRYSVRQINNV
jgi:Pectate lyase superfamily protein